MGGDLQEGEHGDGEERGGGQRRPQGADDAQGTASDAQGVRDIDGVLGAQSIGGWDLAFDLLPWFTCLWDISDVRRTFALTMHRFALHVHVSACVPARLLDMKTVYAIAREGW